MKTRQLTRLEKGLVAKGIIELSIDHMQHRIQHLWMDVDNNKLE